MKKILSSIIFLVLLFVVSFKVYGLIINEVPTQSNVLRTYTFFTASTTPFAVTATTTTATSTNIIGFFDTSGRVDSGKFQIAGAKKVSVFFSRGGVTNPNTGSTLFKVQVSAVSSPSESDWFDFYKMVQATSTAIQQTSIISAATTTQRFDLDRTLGSYQWMRCVVVETTDGEHQCSASAEF